MQKRITCKVKLFPETISGIPSSLEILLTWNPVLKGWFSIHYQTVCEIQTVSLFSPSPEIVSFLKMWYIALNTQKKNAVKLGHNILFSVYRLQHCLFWVLIPCRERCLPFILINSLQVQIKVSCGWNIMTASSIQDLMHLHVNNTEKKIQTFGTYICLIVQHVG